MFFDGMETFLRDRVATDANTKVLINAETVQVGFSTNLTGKPTNQELSEQTRVQSRV
jgi:hypothetical protein